MVIVMFYQLSIIATKSVFQSCYYNHMIHDYLNYVTDKCDTFHSGIE